MKQIKLLTQVTISLLLTTALSGCHASSRPAIPISPSTLALIENASHVETYRLSLTPPANASKHTTVPVLIDGAYVADVGPVEDHAFAKKLATILSDPKTFGSEVAMTTAVTAVLFRVKSSGKTVDIQLDFQGYSFSILTNEAGSNTPTSEVESNFMHNITPIYDLCKTAFPKAKHFGGSD